MGERLQNLLGHWVHSQEEDTGSIRVYRPSSYPLPPSRGRAQLAFYPDFSVKVAEIGRTDLNEVLSGIWKGDIEQDAPLEVSFETGEYHWLVELSEEENSPVLRITRIAP